MELHYKYYIHTWPLASPFCKGCVGWASFGEKCLSHSTSWNGLIIPETQKSEPHPLIQQPLYDENNRNWQAANLTRMVNPKKNEQNFFVVLSEKLRSKPEITSQTDERQLTFSLTLTACSQTLYFIFKVRRARVIKYKLQGIYWPPAPASSPMFLKRTKRVIFRVILGLVFICQKKIRFLEWNFKEFWKKIRGHFATGSWSSFNFLFHIRPTLGLSEHILVVYLCRLK